MKKSRILVSSIFLASAIAASIAAAGCSHKHAYSGDWSTDETNHWHAATCEHTDEKADLGAHDYDANYKCTVCDYQHVHTYDASYKCTVCNYQHTHTYSAYESDVDNHWQKDNCGHGTATDPESHTFDSNFTCTVCNYTVANVGIVIDKGTTNYTLDSSLTMDVPMDDFAVKIHKENGIDVEGDVQYTLKYYKGDVEITDLNNVGEGSYNVWATATLDGKQTETFIVIDIFDEVESIAFKTGSVQQEVGANTMSKTWKYTVTYKSGRQVEVGADDVKVDGVATNQATNDGKATVSYIYKNFRGKETTVQTEVAYTVKAAGSSAGQAQTITIGSDKFTNGTLTEKTVVEDGVLSITASADASVVIEDNAKSYTDESDSSNNRSFTKRVKLGGEGKAVQRSLEIMTTGKAKIVVYAMSSSGSATRQVALYDSTFVDKTETPDAIIGTAQECPGDKLYKLEWEVEAAGTYYVACQASGLNVYGVEITTEAAPSMTEQTITIGSDKFTNGTLTEKTVVEDGVLSITASADASVVIEDNAKSYTDASDSSNNRSFTKRVKLGGEGKAVQRSLEIMTTGKAKIVVYAMSSSGSATRQVALYDSTFVDKTETPDAIIGTAQECPGDKLYKLEWEVEAAGTYYVACQASGLNVYGVEIIYN